MVRLQSEADEAQCDGIAHCRLPSVYGTAGPSLWVLLSVCTFGWYEAQCGWY